MKKISKGATILLVISVILISGCSLFQKKEEAPKAEVTEIQLEKKIGVVTTLSDQQFLTGPSDFLLLTDSGERIFITSLSVNLKKYKLRRVEIEGKFDDAKTVFGIESITSIGNEIQTKQAYQNSEFGLKFNYPSIWIVKEKKNVTGLMQVLITPYEVEEDELNNVDNIVIERSENNKKLNAQKWLNLDDQYGSADPLDSATYQKSLIGVGQLDSVKKTSVKGERIDFFVSRDMYIYHFSHITQNDADKDLYKNAFFDLVASFEFIPFGTPPLGGATFKKETDIAKKTPAPAPIPPLIVTPVVTPAVTPEPIINAKDIFVEYINKNITTLAKEPASLGGTWSVQQIQFAYPEGKPDEFNAIYVVYEDGHDLRKILLSVSDKTDPSKMQVAAYFKPGETTDWSIADGADTAKDNEKSVGSLVIKKGMSVLDAKNFKIKIQYPSSWYWASIKDGYGFSNKPVSADNVLIKLLKAPPPMPAEIVVVCKDIESEKYCLIGAKDYEEIMKQMVETLQYNI